MTLSTELEKSRCRKERVAYAAHKTKGFYGFF